MAIMYGLVGAAAVGILLYLIIILGDCETGIQY